jgi:hypothetical protein
LDKGLRLTLGKILFCIGVELLLIHHIFYTLKVLWL